eukprot:868077-Pyramimonas_sp.AAC.1
MGSLQPTSPQPGSHSHTGLGHSLKKHWSVLVRRVESELHMSASRWQTPRPLHGSLSGAGQGTSSVQLTLSCDAPPIPSNPQRDGRRLAVR